MIFWEIIYKIFWIMFFMWYSGVVVIILVFVLNLFIIIMGRKIIMNVIVNRCNVFILINELIFIMIFSL